MARSARRDAGRDGLRPAEASSSGGLRAKAWVPAVIGGALVVTSSVLFAMTKGLEQQLSAGDLTLVQGGVNVGDVVERGERLQTASVVTGAVGLAGLAVAAAFLIFGAPESPSVGFWASPHGAFALVQGRFP